MTEQKSKYKILIIDDDKFLLDMYSIKFGEHDFEVTTAGSGEDALEKVEAGLRPDVYLTDLLMPKIDGFQFVSKLHEKGIGEGVAIIILSNLGQKEDIDKGLKLGVDGYVVKASATPSEVVNKTIDIVKTKLKANS